MNELTLLIVEDDKHHASDINEWAKEAGFQKACISVARYPAEAKTQWNENGGFDAIVLDLKMEGEERAGFQLLKELRAGRTRPRRVFVYSGHLNDLLLPCEAVQTDVVSFHLKSGGESVLRDQLKAFVEAHKTSRRAQIYSGSATWRELELLVPYLAKSELHVLMLGATGSGKTTFAKHLAEESKIAAERTITINCAAIPENLIESELFGHRRGSFTGASEDKAGKLLVASGFNTLEIKGLELDRKQNAYRSSMKHWGAVILDEVGALPLHLQAKLLTVLDGSPIDPVGNGGRPGYLPNFRVFSATNEIEKLNDPKLFRRDLRQRLQGWVVNVPDISEQQGLIAQLLDRDKVFFRNDSGLRDAMLVKWTADARQFLLSKECLSQIEGGIREIKNIIARASLYASMEIDSKTVTKEMVEKSLQQTVQPCGKAPASPASSDNSSAETEAKAKIQAWLDANSISSDELNYKKLLAAIPIEKYQLFVDFIKTEFTRRGMDQKGFIAVMCKGVKEVPAATVKSAFTNKIKGNGGSASAI